MAEDDMETKLKELKEVDPETFEYIGDLTNVIRINADGSFGVDSDDIDFIIQGCIQRAIAATRSEDFLRDLFWKIEMVEKDEYEASIYDRENLLADVTASSPVAAILAAYLAAKRAMR